MNAAELKKRIAEVLGVSQTQKELAFEVFTDNLSEILEEGLTLKVPRIGYFQIKSDPNIRNSQQIIFSAFAEDYLSGSKNLYLTFDLNQRSKNSFELDSQIFSIGVGKPLLPLIDEDNLRDSETSFEMLKKSIEERVKELIADSDQLPNYNLWDEILDQTDSENSDESITINGMNYADLNNRSVSNNDELNNSPNLLESLLSDKNFEIKNDFIDDEKINELLNSTTDEDNFINIDVNIPEELSVNNLLQDNLNPTLDESKSNSFDEENPIEFKTFAEELVKELTQLDDEKEDEKAVDDESSSVSENNIRFDDLNSIIDETFVNFEEIINEDKLGSIDFLFNDEVEQKNEEEISIEPPTSSKELIIDDPTEQFDSIVTIEVDDLKEIIKGELNEYDSEKISEANSRVLSNLLKEDDIKSLGDTSEKTEDTELDVGDESIESLQNVEWNWGDELKEEFGIGLEDNIKKEVNVFNNYSSLKVSEPTEEESQIDFSIPEPSELKKTRIDLFTRLEQTLEKEINFLKDELKEKEEEFTLPNYEEPIIKTKEAVVQFRDEKMILDFKTPPPKYEFIEEKPEPILEPPKRITIILSPDEVEEKAINKQNIEEVEYSKEEISEPIKEKRNYWKSFAIILIFSVGIVAIVSLVWSFIRQNNIENSVKTADLQKEQINSSSNNFQEELTTDNSASKTKIEFPEYSDFPTTATPPVPTKSGIVEEFNKGTTPLKSTINSPDQKKVKEQKNSIKNTTSSNVNETRLGNMVFFDGRSYNFQISSWKNKGLAETEVSRLRSLGFNAFLVEAYLPAKGGTWYRVRIGNFNSENEAFDFMRKNNF